MWGLSRREGCDSAGAALPVWPVFPPKWVSPAILQLCPWQLYDLPVFPAVLTIGTAKAAAEPAVAAVLSALGIGRHRGLVAPKVSGFWGPNCSPKTQRSSFVPAKPHLHFPSGWENKGGWDELGVCTWGN